MKQFSKQVRRKSVDVFDDADIQRMRNYQLALIDHQLYSQEKNKFWRTNMIVDEIKNIEIWLKKTANNLM